MTSIGSLVVVRPSGRRALPRPGFPRRPRPPAWSRPPPRPPLPGPPPPPPPPRFAARGGRKEGPAMVPNGGPAAPIPAPRPFRLPLENLGPMGCAPVVGPTGELERDVSRLK
ncbi:hypothetical protein F7P10_31415 [Actinomadura sp. WMMB 499]|nr:hypothetical protein F7P10_31415 [Actinomadura sp. WMMB 499]